MEAHLLTLSNGRWFTAWRYLDYVTPLTWLRDVVTIISHLI